MLEGLAVLAKLLDITNTPNLKINLKSTSEQITILDFKNARNEKILSKTDWKSELALD